MVVRSGHKVESETGHNVDLGVLFMTRKKKKKKKKSLAKDGQSDQSLRVARRLRAVLKTPWRFKRSKVRLQCAKMAIQPRFRSCDPRGLTH